MKRQIVIPYTPRSAFLPFHERKTRWAAIVAHRRAGKTVAAINDCVKRGLEKNGHYALIAPFRAQIKKVAWEYLKHYSSPVRRVPADSSANEAELTVHLLNRTDITLFGADNPDSLRGLGFDGVYLDEYGDFKPSVWGNIIRPTLSDRQGWAVFTGTPKGHNQFFKVAEKAKVDPEWFYLNLPASKSGILPQLELDDARTQLTEDQYLQEYECSFDAAILGAYYGREMREATEGGRIREVPYDPEVPVYTAWDLGYEDDTAIWFYQLVADEIHIIHYYGVSGANIQDLADYVIGYIKSLIEDAISKEPWRWSTDRPRGYRRHWLPHDAKARTLASGGKSVIEQLAKYLGMSNLAIVPDLSVQDGIQAARAMLVRVWFDDSCQEGIEALRQYQREWDEDKKAFKKTPRHDWTSHPADGFRYLAIAERKEPAPPSKPKQRTLQTMTLDELWEYTELQQAQEKRI